MDEVTRYSEQTENEKQRANENYIVNLANEFEELKDQNIVTALCGLIVISFVLALYFFFSQAANTVASPSGVSEDGIAREDSVPTAKLLQTGSRTLEAEVIEPNAIDSRLERVSSALEQKVLVTDTQKAVAEEGVDDRAGGSNNPASVARSSSDSAQVKSKVALTENEKRRQKNQIKLFCAKLGEKLGSVSTQDCLAYDFQHSGTLSNEKTPLVYLDYGSEQKEAVKVLLFGGIHGDEFSAVSIVFKWLKFLESEYADGSESTIHWRIVPVLNPDGLLQPDGMSKRMNANNVDLNRNFPTPDWQQDAMKYWVERTGRNERRFPGQAPASELETQWVLEQLEVFDPDAVISVHAPYGIVDADGPAEPPQKLGPLELKLLGTYPGSMGRYIGVHKNLPMLTVELERAGAMPKKDDIEHIWLDIQDWIAAKVHNRDAQEAAEMQSIRRLETDDNGSTVIDKKGGD